MAAVQAAAKISFEPGSATIAADAYDTMDKIAAILNRCGEIRLEIQGHTDSQGREGMNQQLSQARAQSVLNELRARRVLTGTYVATGYGETQPIADNATEQGREDNRRIAFHLIRPNLTDQPETTLESIETAPGAAVVVKPDSEAAPETDPETPAEAPAKTPADTPAEVAPDTTPDTVAPASGTDADAPAGQESSGPDSTNNTDTPPPTNDNPDGSTSGEGTSNE